MEKSPIAPTPGENGHARKPPEWMYVCARAYACDAGLLREHAAGRIG